MTTTTTKTAQEIGTEIGRAIAADVLGNEDMSIEWTGIEAQDADRIPEGIDHDEVEIAAEQAYHVALAESKVEKTVVYVVRDASGEYVRSTDDSADRPRRTPAENEAMEFESIEEARAACRRGTDRVLSREID